jgi:hypothetical protein
MAGEVLEYRQADVTDADSVIRTLSTLFCYRSGLDD